MPKIISIHSFPRGTGKSTVTANLAVTLASQGLRVGLIDADIVAPALHGLFSVNDTGYSLNAYLQGECGILDAVRDVTPQLGGKVTGRILLIPASDDTVERARAARQEYTFQPLYQATDELFTKLGLDALLLDAPAGLTEGSLFLFGVSDASAIVLRLDKQDYLGTSIMVEVARKLGIPRLMLVVNLAPRKFDLAEIKAHIVETYAVENIAVLPYSEELLALSSTVIFAAKYPDQPLTSLFKQIAVDLMR